MTGAFLKTVEGRTVQFECGPNDEGRTTWAASVVDLPGACVSVGDSREECEAMIREAIALHIEAL